MVSLPSLSFMRSAHHCILLCSVFNSSLCVTCRGCFCCRNYPPAWLTHLLQTAKCPAVFNFALILCVLESKLDASSGAIKVHLLHASDALPRKSFGHFTVTLSSASSIRMSIHEKAKFICRTCLLLEPFTRGPLCRASCNSTYTYKLHRNCMRHHLDKWFLA